MTTRTFSVALLLMAVMGAALEGRSQTLIVGNGELKATLSTEGVTKEIRGRLSFEGVATGDDVAVRNFNLVFFSVPQSLIAKDISDNSVGVLAFAIAAGTTQHLQIASNRDRLVGTLSLAGDAAFLIELAQPVADGGGDVFVTPSLPAIVNVVISLPVIPPLAEGELRKTASATFSLESKGTVSREFRLEIETAGNIAVDFAPFTIFEVERRLCIQPVDLQHRNAFGNVNESGAGFSFGRPAAELQWRKVDIVFEYRAAIIIPAEAFWKLKPGEAKTLLDKVSVEDCIEIFFPYAFQPKDQWGGGATWAPRQSIAKIISSDGNAREGIDKTHLAHELGHVLGLMHPNFFATGNLVPGSPGTLLCASGFKQDNPQCNSTENGRFAYNPLLVHKIKRRDPPDPDCQGVADCESVCGMCP